MRECLQASLKQRTTLASKMSSAMIEGYVLKTLAEALWKPSTQIWASALKVTPWSALIITEGTARKTVSGLREQSNKEIESVLLLSKSPRRLFLSTRLVAVSGRFRSTTDALSRRCGNTWWTSESIGRNLGDLRDATYTRKKILGDFFYKARFLSIAC